MPVPQTTYRLRYQVITDGRARYLPPRFDVLWKAVTWALENRLGMPSGVYSVMPSALVEITRED